MRYVARLSIVICIGALQALAGCGNFAPQLQNSIGVDQLARGYQPIDPQPIKVLGSAVDGAASVTKEQVNESIRGGLANTLTRMAIGRLDTTGTVRFGPIETGRAGESYVIVVDRILYSTASVNIEYFLADVDVTSELIKSLAHVIEDDNLAEQISTIPTNTTLQMMFDESAGEYISLFSQIGQDRFSILASVTQSENDFVAVGDAVGQMSVEKLLKSVKTWTGKNISYIPPEVPRDDLTYAIPVYIGVGVRMRFELSVLSGDINLTAYSSFGGQLTSNQIQGTVTLQTLGINGSGVSDLVPVPIDITDASVPLVLQSLMSIFSKIYTDDEIVLHPQVLGFDSPAVLPGGAAYLESVVRGREYEMDLSTYTPAFSGKRSPGQHSQRSGE